MSSSCQHVPAPGSPRDCGGLTGGEAGQCCGTSLLLDRIVCVGAHACTVGVHCGSEGRYSRGSTGGPWYVDTAVESTLTWSYHTGLDSWHNLRDLGLILSPSSITFLSGNLRLFS